jgi:Lrp/AsnC family transcriptional regulator, leucine-responsive regulatory protein
MTELSNTDLRILRTLQREASLTNVELAERVGMSPSPCLRRVRQLEERGVIKDYVAVLDRRALGFDVMAFVEVRMDHHSDTAAEAFTGAVLKEPAVIACYTTSGEYDYMLTVVVRNLDDYADFAMKRLLRMPGVKDVRSSFVLQNVKESTALPLEHRAGG